MKTADFITMFKDGRLGSKRTFGAYKVFDGDHCKVLVHSVTLNGKPNGSELLGISFNKVVGHPTITMFHNGNYSNLRNSVLDFIDRPVRITGVILDENAEDLLDSGIIDIDEANTKMLIEIGSTPWLLEHHENYEDDRSKQWRYNVGSRVGVRCETIEAALVNLKPEPNAVDALGWTMERCAADFVPNAISDTDRAVLAAPPNPISYGFKVEDCTREVQYSRGSLGCNKLNLMPAASATAQGKAFKAAISEYDDALERFNNTTPTRHEGVSTSRGGCIVTYPNGMTYVKGRLNRLYDSSTAVELDVWHKLVTQSNKMKLR